MGGRKEERRDEGVEEGRDGGGILSNLSLNCERQLEYYLCVIPAMSRLFPFNKCLFGNITIEARRKEHMFSSSARRLSESMDWSTFDINDRLDRC
jgi:hypothetical protein